MLNCFSRPDEVTSRCNSAATAVDTRERKEMSCGPCRGSTELVNRITYVLVYGSIHMEVPVNPVWPNDPTGRSAPRLEENEESMSQPSPRTSAALGGCCGVVIFSITSPSRMVLRLMSACAYSARSPAVEN